MEDWFAKTNLPSTKYLLLNHPSYISTISRIASRAPLYKVNDERYTFTVLFQKQKNHSDILWFFIVGVDGFEPPTLCL